MKRILAAGAALAVSAALYAASPASATTSSPSSSDHCVAAVTTKLGNGELKLASPVCRRTAGDALRASGIVEVSPSGDQATTAGGSAIWIIGIHYDGPNFTGASLIIQGQDCLGGFLNLYGDWWNRISSTKNGCWQIAHWDGFNRTGQVEYTRYQGGNLGSMNNRANSISYHN